MTYPANEREKQIAMLLAKWGTSVAQVGAGRWNFALANGKTMSASAHLFEEWLIFDAPISDRIARTDFWRLLRLNAVLDGATKFVLMPDDHSVHARAELALPGGEALPSDCELDPADILPDRVRDACAGLKAAFVSFHGKGAAGHSESQPARSSNEEDESYVEELKRRCGDTGWTFNERSAGKLVVDLDAEGGFYQAVLDRRNATFKLSVELAQWEALTESSRQALGLMLLKTGGLVRLVRPLVQEEENRAGARVEVRFSSIPTAIELAQSFSSLSVACTICGREAWAIQDEIVAREYLMIGGRAGDHPAFPEAMIAAAD